MGEGDREGSNHQDHDLPGGEPEQRDIEGTEQDQDKANNSGQDDVDQAYPEVKFPDLKMQRRKRGERDE